MKEVRRMVEAEYCTFPLGSRMHDALRGLGHLHLLTVAIRRAPEFGPVRPEAEQLDGKTFWFRYGFTFDPEERYGGEVAWTPCDSRYPANGPHWIASGDLGVMQVNRAPLSGAVQVVMLEAPKR